MAIDLREQKLGQIAKSAELERAGVEYIIGLIEANENELRAAFIPEDEAVSEEDIPETLYEGVTVTLGLLERERTRAFGVLIRYMPIGHNCSEDPAVKMGWLEYSPMFGVPEDYVEGTDFPHSMWLTEKGTAVIDGLRSARGLASLEEQAHANRTGWDKAIRRANEEASVVED